MMTLGQIFLGQVPPELQGQVIQEANSIGISRGSYLSGGLCGWFTCSTRTAVFSFVGYYIGTIPEIQPQHRWQSEPVLHCQGELLGICQEPPPAYDCVIFDWPSVQCKVQLKQTVYKGVHNEWFRFQKIDESRVKEIVFFDTGGLLAKRAYPPPTIKPWYLPRFFSPGAGEPILITVDIRIEMKLKGGYLYFSSRCDSVEFLIDLPPSYTLTYVGPPP